VAIRPEVARRLRPRLVRSVAALLIALLIPGACVAWLVLQPSQGDRFLATLDTLPVPPGWEPVHTEVIDGGFIVQPRATRYFFVDVAPDRGPRVSEDTLAVAKSIATAAGFTIHPLLLSRVECPRPESHPSPCPPWFADECDSNYEGGPPTHCTVQAVRGLDSGAEQVERLWMNLYPPGHSFSVGQGEDRRQVSDPSRALVLITANFDFHTNFIAPSVLPSAARSTPG
jgi:hypothetical protein